MDMLVRMHRILDEVENDERQQKAETPKGFPYEVYIVGNDSAVGYAALQLNKRVGASEFNHVCCVDGLNVLRFTCAIKGIPVRNILKLLAVKTRRDFPYEYPKKADVRDSTEDSPNESSKPEVAAEGLREDAGVAVLGHSSVLDSKEQDVQHTEASVVS
jgi:hypothetical protein